MTSRDAVSIEPETLERVLGYLNFSSGASDPKFLQGLNAIYAGLVESPADRPTWQQALELLASRLSELKGTSSTFADIDQAETVLHLLREHVVPGYRVYHRDLLFHRDDDRLFTPFMLGRMFESALRQPKPWDDLPAIAERTILQLNDFIGHRPVPSLETQKIQPRPKEWVRPIPVYIEGAGVSVGPYQEIIEIALRLLRETDEEILQQANFRPDMIEELAIDPRPYDFDHPANRRPNYHFGEWDPSFIDNKGYYRRLILREVNLRALIHRVEKRADDGPSREELLWEAAAVLAGTILMAAGMSGAGPDAHDSNTTLMTLIARIADYRDAFYVQLMERLEGPHRKRLREEAKRLLQPLGGARQHLNAHLARQRAEQLEHVRLAKVFARMGYIAAAQRQVDAVRVTSARMLCRIDCAITAGHQATLRHDRSAAIAELDRIIDLLHRGIECGAIVDPWNILGFDGNFSLFPALENSIRDERIDDLVSMMDRVFDLFARVWSDAAVKDDLEMAARIEARFEETATWWHQFAAHEVSSVHAASALKEFEAARQVTEALNKWHRGGAKTGDVRFWAPYVENFDSPKAYALVIETLLVNDDHLSAMSLLIHWIGQADRVPLESGESSFHQVANRWVRTVVEPLRTHDQSQSEAAEQTWKLVRRFFELLEANAEEYWETPRFRLGHSAADEGHSEGDEQGAEDEESSNDLFQAAYEDVVFRDSTDDGVEGFVYDTNPHTNEELQFESERIVDRLAFLECLAKSWTVASIGIGRTGSLLQHKQPGDSLRDWYGQARRNREGLFTLLREIGRQTIPRPAGNHQSMIDYDRHRLIKDTLIEQIISTIVEVSQAERFLLAGAEALSGAPLPNDANQLEDDLSAELRRASRLLAAALRRDRDTAARLFDDFLDELAERDIVYVPLSRSGSGSEIAMVRMRQRIIENLLIALPRLGLIAHTIDLIDTAREMEFNAKPERAAVTQFDELFDVGYRELVRCLVRTTKPKEESKQEKEDADAALIEFLEQLTESVLGSWLEHSRTLRLSVLERVRNKDAWKELVDFIQNFGEDIFTQSFFRLANIRAILHCGVENWLRQIEESGVEPPFRLLRELDKSVPRGLAVDLLTLILEAIVENYGAYCDYNSTYTQSDKGSNLYTLLDFLRLQSAYDRVAWNLKPVVISHEVLVRNGRNEAAQMWRRALSERVGGEASRYLKRLTALQKKYAMHMATVADRLGEKFMRPMTIDRMRALVEPAIEELNAEPPHHHFEILESETDFLMREPSGSGVDVPPWLTALEEEIDNLKPWNPNYWNAANENLLILPYALSREELEDQLDEL